MKLKLGLPKLLSFTLIWSQQAFCFQFHHLSLCVNAAIHWQYDLVYKVIPDPICRNVSSVAWLVIADNKLYTDSMTWFTRSFQIPFLRWFPLSLVQNLFIADPFGKVCKTAKIAFSLMCQLLFGVENNHDDPLHAHRMLFTVKALYPL